MYEVSIILRTCDRYVFLDRAIKDIMKQDYLGWKIILVNDGADEKHILNILEKNAVCMERVNLITLEKGKGLHKSINVGARAVNTPYVVVHDDDDTWETNFLEKTISYLNKYESCKGVITHTNQIMEKVINEEIIITKIKPFNTNLQGVISIYDMFKNNQFPPISFVYRSEVYNQVGYFNESLEVLEDWEFYLRFLTKYDIHVIEECLANYHIRKQTHIQASYRNTITDRKKVHQKYDTIIRNMYLREDMNKDRVGIGVMLNILRWSETKVEKTIKRILRLRRG